MIKNHSSMPQKIQRRHSFPLQIDLKLASVISRSSPISSHQSTTVAKNQRIAPSSPLPLMNACSDDDLTKYKNNVYPLTEENLAIHTKNFPPCRDARRHNARLFADNQKPVVELELILAEKREKEIATLIPVFVEEQDDTRRLEIIQFSNPFGEQQQKKNKSWLKRITHWVRLDSIRDNNKSRRHFSWSACTEMDKYRQQQQYDTTTIATINNEGSSVLFQHHQQQRDSGISMMSGKRRSTSAIMRLPATIVSIPIAKQLRFSPSQHDEFIAFKYPKMVQRRNSHVAVHENDKDNYESCTHHEKIRLKSPLDIHHHSSVTAA